MDRVGLEDHVDPAAAEGEMRTYLEPTGKVAATEFISHEEAYDEFVAQNEDPARAMGATWTLKPAGEI